MAGGDQQLADRRSRSRSSEAVRNPSRSPRRSGSRSTSPARSSRSLSRRKSRSRKRKRTPSSSSSSSESSRSRSRERSFVSDSDQDSDRGKPERYKIPKRSDFVDAQEEVPEPPNVPKKKAIPRVIIDKAAKEAFEELAAGKLLTTEDRQQLLKDIPRINSKMATPAQVDDELKGQFSEKKSIEVSLTDSEFEGIYSALLSSLQIQQLILKLGADDEGAPFGKKALGYINLISELLSSGIKEVITAKRVQLLRRLGVSPVKAMPSFKELGLDTETVSGDRKSDVGPCWFGRELLDELTAEDSSVRKALDKLRGNHGRKKSSSKPSKKYKSSKKSYDKKPFDKPAARGGRGGGRGRGRK